MRLVIHARFASRCSLISLVTMRRCAPLLLLLAAVLPSVRCECPSADWTPFRELCYRLLDYQWTWEDARDACEVLLPGATHASAHDDQQNTFLAETVAQGRRVWLGLRQPVPHYDWYWQDGTDTDYTAWDTYQPLAGDYMASCAVLNSLHTGKWANEDCNSYHSGFICQTTA